MSKNKIDRKINRVARNINKMLKKDLFKDRFWIRQVKKTKGEDGLQYYLYEMCDRLEPERNSYLSIGWLWGESHFLLSEFFGEINDFIVKSDFWAKYYNDPTRYREDIDVYKRLR